MPASSSCTPPAVLPAARLCCWSRRLPITDPTLSAPPVAGCFPCRACPHRPATLHPEQPPQIKPLPPLEPATTFPPVDTPEPLVKSRPAASSDVFRNTADCRRSPSPLFQITPPVSRAPDHAAGLFEQIPPAFSSHTSPDLLSPSSDHAADAVRRHHLRPVILVGFLADHACRPPIVDQAVGVPCPFPSRCRFPPSIAADVLRWITRRRPPPAEHACWSPPIRRNTLPTAFP